MDERTVFTPAEHLPPAAPGDPPPSHAGGLTDPRALRVLKTGQRLFAGPNR